MKNYNDGLAIKPQDFSLEVIWTWEGHRNLPLDGAKYTNVLFWWAFMGYQASRKGWRDHGGINKC